MTSPSAVPAPAAAGSAVPGTQRRARRKPPPIASLWESKAGRVVAIDGLRGIGITDVVVSHVSDRWTPGGVVFVDLFFVVSGYVITRLLLREWGATSGIDLRRFYRARWTRLGPAQFVCIGGVCVLLAGLGGHWIFDLKKAPYALTYTMNFWRAAQPNTLGENAWAGVFNHTWSLAVEEQFYLLWPLLLLFLLRRVSAAKRLPILLIICGATVIERLVLASFGDRMINHIYNSPECRIDQLLSGCAIALLIHQRGGVAPAWLLRLTRLAIWPVLAAFAVVLLRFHSTTTTNVFAEPVVMTFSTICGCTLVCCLSFLPAHPVTRFLSLRPFVAVGTLCYSIYIWHHPVAVFVKSIHGLNVAEQLALTISITLPISVLSWRYIETRFHRSQVLRYAPPAEKAAGLAQEAAGIPASVTGPSDGVGGPLDGVESGSDVVGVGFEAPVRPAP